LKHMKTLAEVASAAGPHPASLLISGGCTTEGKVPLAAHIAEISALKQHMRYNLHVGLLDDQDISGIAKIADAVSFDFVGSDDTIREVFGLNRSVQDYSVCYQKLSQNCMVIPHICIGLDGGKIKGEYRAIRELKALGAPAITFIIFTPTRGTKFADCQPPAIEAVLEVLVEAREEFPDTPLSLGCMRPGGSYRRQIDKLAVQAGINGIVNPAAEAVNLACELGLVSERREECCAL